MTWLSRIQTGNALNTREDQFIDLNEGLRMIIALKSLLEKISQQGVIMRGWGTPQVYQRQFRRTH